MADGLDRMTPSEESARWSRLSRHPLAAVTLAFLLSGVLVTLVANYYGQRQAKLERERTATAARRQAVQTFSRFIYERRVRAEMLWSSLHRRAALEEVRERKRLYDEAFVAWNSNLQANHFLVREVLEASDYSEFEGAVESRLVFKIFRPLDHCLTRAYDARIAGADPLRVLEECNATSLIQQALDCGWALTNELYKLGAVTRDTRAGKQEGARREVEQRCP
jgi:hypothetical protein